MPLARPHSSKPSSRQARHCLAGISTTCCTVVRSSDGGGLAGVGVPNKSRFRYCLSALRRRFQPRACISARSFLLEGRSGSSLSSRTELLASQSRNSQVPAPPCGGRTNPLRAGERDAESTRVSEQPARFSPDHVFPRVSVHIERGMRVPVPSRAMSSNNRVPSSSCRCHLLFLWRPCIPGGCKDGTPNLRLSVRFRFCPDRTQRSLLLSVRIHHVLTLVVKALSNPRFRLDLVFSTSPFRATTPAPGCWQRGTPNAFRCLRI